MSSLKPDLDSVHCPGCVRCHLHGDGECDGEYETDRPGPSRGCDECPGYSSEPHLHVMCGKEHVE